MLPDIRKDLEPYSVPIFNVDKKDVNNFINELKGFHSEFADCFQRSEPRVNFFQYMIGQFSELERKSIEPIALKVKNGKVRAMQRTISESFWDEKKILSKYHGLVSNDMGHPDGVIIFDETGFVKKGSHSVGVARQYCGSIGKVENSQVGVFCAYASPYGYALLDKRLFIPEIWFEDDYKEKREKCKLPEDIKFKTKPQLAVDMLEKLCNQEILPSKYIVADCLYGNSPDFIAGLDKCIDKIYFVSIPSDTLCWLRRPVTRKKEYNFKGEVRIKDVLDSKEKNPISVKELANNLNDYFWYRRKVAEGTKGPIEYEFSKREVIISKEGLPWRTFWLIMKRTISDNPEYSFYISNAPISTRLNTFVWLSGFRVAIEQCFEENKSELGMDQYEVRKYPGWHHHMLTCMLGHFFLWHLKIKLGKKSTSYYFVSVENFNRGCTSFE